MRVAEFAARLEDLLVVERLARHTGGEVGDEGDAEDLRTGLARRDRLENRRHADEVRAEDTSHPDLGRRLVVRPGELRVDALLQGGVDLLAEGAQPRRVQVGQVDEVRARRSGTSPSG